MRESVAESLFDGLTQNLEELCFASSLFGKHISDHIDSEFRIRKNEHPHCPQLAPDDVLATAYALNILYVDALIGSKLVLRGLEEQIGAVAARGSQGQAGKDATTGSVVKFLVNATV